MKRYDDYQDDSLLNISNLRGFIRFRSYRGHSWPINHCEPYIAFETEPNKSSRLIELLRQNMECIDSQLKWDWRVDEWFNTQDELCFALRVCGHRRWVYRFKRRSIHHDFSVIKEMLVNTLIPQALKI